MNTALQAGSQPIAFKASNRSSVREVGFAGFAIYLFSMSLTVDAPVNSDLPISDRFSVGFSVGFSVTRPSIPICEYPNSFAPSGGARRACFGA
jgi:hypothetical protein